MLRRFRFVPLAVAAAGVAGAVIAQDAGPKDKAALPVIVSGAGVATAKSGDDAKKPATATPPTAKVEKAPFRVEVTLKGVFEAPDVTEVAVKPEAWGGGMGGFTVVKAVEAGAAVKKGDVLVTFDPEKIDKALRDLETEQALADLAIRQAELDLPILERTTPLDLAAAERANTRAQEDLKKFLDVDRKLTAESAEFSLKNSRHQLEYVQEELKQLEKMYRSKDLTEETEEIILKRQRNQVENAKFMLRMSENRHEQTMKLELPRREQDIKDSAEKAAISWEKARATIPLALNQKKFALEKARYERARAVEKLGNMKKDRELFTVKAPADGIVYYGKCVNGNWTTASALATRLQKGGSVSADEVFMTIVRPGKMFVRAVVDEKDLALAPAGAAARVVPASLPDAKLAAKVERVAPIPVGGSFDARVALAAAPAGVVPGMACSVKVTAYSKSDALVVPASAVFADDADEEKTYVYKAVPDGKPQKQPVTIGKRSAGKAEVLSGLAAGDEVLLTKPS